MGRKSPKDAGLATLGTGVTNAIFQLVYTWGGCYLNSGGLHPPTLPATDWYQVIGLLLCDGWTALWKKQRRRVVMQPGIEPATSWNQLRRPTVGCATTYATWWKLREKMAMVRDEVQRKKNVSSAVGSVRFLCVFFVVYSRFKAIAPALWNTVPACTCMYIATWARSSLFRRFTRRETYVEPVPLKCGKLAR